MCRHARRAPIADLPEAAHILAPMPRQDKQLRRIFEVWMQNGRRRTACGPPAENIKSDEIRKPGAAG